MLTRGGYSKPYYRREIREKWGVGQKERQKKQERNGKEIRSGVGGLV